jgi:formylglycine-generating enzyme required for sulfatase activity/pimeloyl-ACP methyl ester carboxylesterase
MVKFRVLIALAASAACAQDLVPVPGGSYEVTDQITSVKMRVSVSDFLLGAAEVTQQQYQAITSSNPSTYKGADRPVENVNWWDAIRYCNLRSAAEGLQRCYDLSTGSRERDCTGYRLPTEAEWIRAAGGKPQEEESRSFHLGVSSTKSTDVLKGAMQKGTAPVRTSSANSLGIYDLRGNVWEWCDDFFDAIASPDAVRDPSGPAVGLEKVIRGGSFVSTISRWSRDYRSSMNPEVRSRFTGFRVARSINKPVPETAVSDDFFKRYNNAPQGFESSTGSLSPLVQAGGSPEAWREKAADIKSRWVALLSEPKLPVANPTARLIREVTQRNFTGQLMQLEMEPEVWEKIYVLRPANSAKRPAPVMIVPFYDVDTPAAIDLGGRNYAADRGVNAFAYTAAQHGYIAVAVRWFGESYGASYSEAVANLSERHPGSTGLGKWIADVRRVVDFIETLPDADATRIGIMGHSLGGKMALYAAAFEPRIRATVSSELGVGFKFSNYEDYWYLGENLAKAPAGMDQHELIGLIAPRPFLLIGGDEFDKKESWYYINAARAVYALSGNGKNIGYFNHHTGHTPSPEAVSLAFDWLDHFLKP